MSGDNAPRTTLGSLRRWAARPEGWLLLTMAWVYARFRQLGHLEPVRSADAASYEWPWELMTLSDALHSLRTFGYPIVLRVWGLFSDSHAALPTFHLLLYFLAVAFFWRSFAAYSGSPWLSFAAVVPLLTSSLLPFVRFVQPELIAPTMAIATVAFLFRLMVHPKRPWLWFGLVAATLATYHLRPIYLAIAALVPLLGVCFRLLAGREGRRRVVRFGAALALATLLPVFAYCGFRWLVVGHFGIINLLGYELVAITANFLDEETVQALPGEYQELGERTLRQRSLRGWKTYTRESVSLPHFRQYGQNQWFIAEPFARQILMRRRHRYRQINGVSALPISPLEAWQIENADRPPLEGDLARAMNDYFQGFGTTLIDAKPELYRKWVVDGYLYGLDRITRNGWIRWPILAIVASVPFLLGARARAGPDRPRADPRGVYALFLLGLGFFLSELLLISIVSWPWDRYLFGAALFLPSALSATLFALWRDVLHRPS